MFYKNVNCRNSVEIYVDGSLKYSVSNNAIPKF